MQFTLALAVLAAALPSTLAICCDSWNNQYCKDGTKRTPCCAYGPCDAVCCKCPTACRTKNGFAPALDQIADTSTEANLSDTIEVFKLADTGHKGYLTLGDYLNYIGTGEDNQMWIDYFALHDLDSDGKLTVEEAGTVV